MGSIDLRHFRHGNSNVDLGAAIQLRRNRERSVHQLHSLPHADEAQPPAPVHRFDIEANPIVANGELNLSRHSQELNFKLRRLTMLRCIVQCLLQHAVQAKCNLGRTRCSAGSGYESQSSSSAFLRTSRRTPSLPRQCPDDPNSQNAVRETKPGCREPISCVCFRRPSRRLRASPFKPGMSFFSRSSSMATNAIR